MKIGVVSDTHLPGRVQRLPETLVRGLQGVDLIVHAGDWIHLQVAELLQQIAPVDGVAGNNDGDEIIEKYGRIKIVKAAGFQIGLVHGDGYLKTTEQRAREAFTESQPDIIIFGHSHNPYNQVHDGILLFNPGSPTDKRRQAQYSFGLIELSDHYTAKHIYFSEI